MTAEELWKQSGLTGEYEVWAFGGAPDELASLVKQGVKTATCSAFCFYEVEEEPLPQEGERSVILDSKDNAVCIIETTRVYVGSYDETTPEHAYKEGEGDRSLRYWKEVHQAFFADELKTIGKSFDPKMKLVYEEFRVIYS